MLKRSNSVFLISILLPGVGLLLIGVMFPNLSWQCFQTVVLSMVGFSSFKIVVRS